MRIVAKLAAAALAALLVALLTGNPWFAVAVITLAAAGIVVLVRDWRGDRNRAIAARSEPESDQRVQTPAPAATLVPDDFSPDLSPDPAGPSSDARAD
jgi:hypothetical protein